MCGRYVPPAQAELESFWHIGRHNWRVAAGPVFNAAPTTEVPMIIRAGDGVIELRGARWGLIPPWWKKETPPSLTFNARSEEAATKPMWRQSLRSQRCLMPARGWYEWHQQDKVSDGRGRALKQPYFVFSPQSSTIAFAALWATWRSADGHAVASCALLTRDAAPALAAIHPRMPVVLAPERFDQWLDPGSSPATVDAAIAQSRTDFSAYPIARAVNDAHNNYPELLARLPAATEPS